MLRLQRLALRGVITVHAMRAHRYGREYIGRGAYRLAAQFTDAGLLQHRVVVADLRLAARPPRGPVMGRASGRGRGGQYGVVLVVACLFKKKRRTKLKSCVWI